MRSSGEGGNRGIESARGASAAESVFMEFCTECDVIFEESVMPKIPFGAEALSLSRRSKEGDLFLRFWTPGIPEFHAESPSPYNQNFHPPSGPLHTRKLPNHHQTHNWLAQLRL